MLFVFGKMAYHRVMNKRKKVVILGAGFAGVYAYLELLKHDKKCDCIEVTCINKTDRFDFVPLAHEVATGGLLPDNTSQSILSLPRDKDTNFIQATVAGIDMDTQLINIEKVEREGSGDKQTHMLRDTPYDYMIMGLGSGVNSFGVPGVFEYALHLKDFDDARRIKNRILDSFESAQYSTDEKKLRELLSFVVIGGGPTGVELAGEMSDFIFGTLKKVYPSLVKKADITLVQSGPVLLGQVDKWFHKKALAILEKKSVHVLFDRRVTKITKDSVEMGEEVMKTRNVYWTAGVKAKEIPTISKNEISIDERSRRIHVDNFLRIPEYKNVFVAGDQGCVVDKETGQPYPMRAQFAVRQGIVAAQNIIADIHKKEQKEFAWKDQGFILSLGRGGALAQVFGVRVSGPLAWWLYRTAYLSKLVGVKAKLRTGLEWAVNLAFSRDVSRL